jgi:hypothetical protein
VAKTRKTVRKTAGGSRKAAAAQGKTAKVAGGKAGAARKQAAGGRKKAVGAKKKTTGGGRKPSRPRASGASELDLSALKKQIRDHVDKLKSARTSDRRVTDALASLQRTYSELESSCGSTMVIPLA